MSSNLSRSWSYTFPWALALMAPFDILASLAMDIYLPVIPEMPTALGTSPAVIQLTLSLYMVMLGAGQIVFGPLSDRLGRRPVLLGGAVVFSLASLALAFTANAWVFVGLRFVQACGASAALVAMFATVRDVYADTDDGRIIYSLFGAILAFVPAIGPVAGSLIAVTFGWRAIFLFLAVAGMAALVPAIFGWHETHRPSRQARQGRFGYVLRDRTFWVYTLGYGSAMGTFFVFFSTAPRVLIDKAGLTRMQFSLAFASVAVVMILATRIVPRMAGRWGNARGLTCGMVLLVTSAGALLIGPFWASSPVAAFILPMWVAAVGIVFTVSVSANGALQSFGDQAGTAVGLYFCIQSLIVSLIGTAFVVLLDGASVWPLAGFATFMPLVTLAALALLPRHPR
ncbi:multidrug effflux MFS transporter [Aquamicrobium sp. NLF2-7]|uniref:CmlA/FloR family chloramphenicol efflux MFS transporter n=1 Tax=Aquamicrobium sp. NLF2-7 TaxID=2918753 RepID=UPI001EFA41C8|nr:CmlA/FloR family chloramphenicol efflux MFS transporter [Aquamicrobium sp. NLF2-7]MCG8272309.1 multidrug effflux MFS transporter [Aquamicrobium sp. NLF2-7]